MSGPGSFGDFADWQAGRVVDRCCLKKIVCGAGLASYSGDAEREFARIKRHLCRHAGFDDGDFLEATYAGTTVDGEWFPRPYHIEDAQSPIERSVRALARELEWYRERLPASRFYLLGYSLGGVIAFEAAAWLLSHDLAGWRGRLAAVVTLASPILGVDFGVLARLARELAKRPDFYGAAGVELVERGTDPETVGQQEVTAALLRASGVRLLTVVDHNDAVVTPGDAVLPSSRAAGEVVSVRAALPGDADEVARRFGHGRAAEVDPVEAELAALKEELRRQRAE